MFLKTFEKNIPWTDESIFLNLWEVCGPIWSKNGTAFDKKEHYANSEAWWSGAALLPQDQDNLL